MAAVRARRVRVRPTMKVPSPILKYVASRGFASPARRRSRVTFPASLVPVPLDRLLDPRLLGVRLHRLLGIRLLAAGLCRLLGFLVTARALRRRRDCNRPLAILGHVD